MLISVIDNLIKDKEYVATEKFRLWYTVQVFDIFSHFEQHFHNFTQLLTIVRLYRCWVLNIAAQELTIKPLIARYPHDMVFILFNLDRFESYVQKYIGKYVKYDT